MADMGTTIGTAFHWAAMPLNNSVAIPTMLFDAQLVERRRIELPGFRQAALLLELA